MDTQQKILELNDIFENSFLNSNKFFFYCYQQAPCVSWINQVNTEKILKYIKTEYATAITGIHQYSQFDKKKKKLQYDTTIILLQEKILVELAHDYCKILHTHTDYDVANTLLEEVCSFRRVEKKKDFEINLVGKDSYGLELKTVEIKKTKLDLGLYYEDDFSGVDKLIQTRLAKKDDKGIVLLHGLPGTGKTTYLRYLIGRLKKKVLFLSPAMAGSVMNPEFMDLLIDNPNSILIIEDAENVIMDRKVNNDSAVSNLLNISDGLLADFLNVQVICTFNHSLSMIDSALLRKGRLIAKYEFGKLGVAKAQALSDSFGFKTVINKPMTIAEIVNQHEKEQPVERVEVIGFRRELLVN